MGEVVLFPGKEVKEANMAKTLWDRIDVLEEKYQGLDRLHQVINEMEQEVTTLEKAYDEVLEEYANSVGADNIEVGILQYSAKAIIEVLPEEGSITIRWGDGKPQDMHLGDEE